MAVMMRLSFGFVTSGLVLASAMLLAGCQQAASPEGAGNEGSPPATAAESNLPVRPGIYGNVAPDPATGKLEGMEMQVHALPRTLIEVTSCKAGCTAIRRIPYQIEGKAMTFAYRDEASSGNGSAAVLTFKISQQGDDVTIEGAGAGSEPLLLKRLPKRDGLTAAEKWMQKAIAP